MHNAGGREASAAEEHRVAASLAVTELVINLHLYGYTLNPGESLFWIDTLDDLARTETAML